MILPQMKRKLLIALVVNLFFAICFHRIAYLDFEKIREPLVVDEAGPDLRFEVPEDLRTPLLLLELRNHSTFDISVRAQSGTGVSTIIPVEASGKSMVYLEPQQSMHLSSTEGDWEVRRAELRNYYGSHKGLFRYLIVPSTAADYEGPGWFWSVLLFLLLFGFTWVAPPLKRRGRILWGVVLFFWMSVLVIPLVSPYRILFAAKTICFFLALLYFPGIRAAYRTLRRKAEERWKENGVAIFHTALAAGAVFLFFVFQMLYSLKEFEGNYSGFLVLSPKFVYKNPLLLDREEITDDLMIAPGEGGYDAQFFYVMSFDPFLRTFAHRPRLYRKVVDAPPYRFGRIGYSVMAKVFSFDRPEFYPQTMIFLILISHFIAALFLARIAHFYNVSALWGLLYLLVPAFTVSLRVGLPESIASAFLVAGTYYFIREKLLPAVVLFAFAILVRETSAVLVACAIAGELLKRRIKIAGLLSLSLAPYLLWRIYLGWRLFPTFKWKAFFFDPEGTNLPFAGIRMLYETLYRGEYVPEAATAATVFGAFLIFLFGFSIFLLWKRRDFITFAFFVYSLLAVSLDYKNVFVPILNAERVTYEAFVLLLVAFLTFRRHFIVRAISLAFFVILLYYDWTIFNYSHFFRAGLLWGG